jgi:hypothetical protein
MGLPLHLFSQSTMAIETQTINCWSKKWTLKNEKALTEGIDALDDYCFKKSLIGKRTVKDYEKFANDTSPFFLPPSLADYDKIVVALKGAAAGAPDVSFFQDCFEPFWLNKINQIDTSDALLNIGKIFIGMKNSGSMDDVYMRTVFFKGLTDQDLQRPLVKAIYYVFIRYNNYIFRGNHDKFIPPPPLEDK